jgi:hypothetical protein
VFLVRRELKRRREEGGKRQSVSWAIGDACRVLYTEDGQEYEGTLVSLDNSRRSECLSLPRRFTEEKFLGSFKSDLLERACIFVKIRRGHIGWCCKGKIIKWEEKTGNIVKRKKKKFKQ